VLWRVRKDSRIADARIRLIPSYGFELLFLVRGSLVYSQMFRDRAALDRLSAEKRDGFIARGWRIEITEPS
jgi:hypothetical protein